MRVCCVLLVFAAAAVVASPPSLFLLKFKKVGGTSIAEVFARLAARDHRETCCALGCEVCYTHESLRTFAASRSATAGHLSVVVLRDPIEREYSRYWFYRALHDDTNAASPSSPETRRATSMSFERWARESPDVRNDYSTVLSRGTRRADDALRALREEFTLAATTAEVDHVLAALSLLLGENVSTMAQRPLKRVLGRPPMLLTNATRDVLTRRLAADMEIWRQVSTAGLLDRSLSRVGLSRDAVDRRRGEMLAYLVAHAADSCQFVGHRAHDLHGKDCYSLAAAAPPPHKRDDY